MGVELDLGTRPDGTRFTVPIECIDRGWEIIGPPGSGKSWLANRAYTEIATKVPEAFVIHLDTAGDSFHWLERWAYAEGLDEELVVINPAEQSRIVAVNPLGAWNPYPALQSRVAAETFRRALRAGAFAEQPLVNEWTGTAMFSLIATALAYRDAPELFRIGRSPLRDAVIDRLPDSPARRNWEALAPALARGSDLQGLRVLLDHLGPTRRRIEEFTANPDLRLMLSSTGQAISLRRAVNQRRKVLVHAGPGVLPREDARLLCSSILAELVHEAFRREAGLDERIPMYVFCDEWQDFNVPGMTEILYGGRKFNFRVIAIHHDAGQLEAMGREDPMLPRAVLGCMRAKTVFGGLSPDDATVYGRLIWEHFCDPRRKKLVLTSKRQLQVARWVNSYTTGQSYQRGLAAMVGSMEAEGEGAGRVHGVVTGKGVANASGFGSGDSEMLLYGPDGLDADIVGMTRGSSLQATGSLAENRFEAETDAESTTKFRMRGRTEAQTDSEGWSRHQAITRSLGVFPTEPFDEISNVTFWPVAEQLHLMIAAMVRQPDRDALFTYAKEKPELFRTAELEEPSVDPWQAREVHRLLLRKQRWATPQEIEEEVEDRHRKLLGPGVRHEPLDTKAAIGRLRDARAGGGKAA